MLHEIGNARTAITLAELFAFVIQDEGNVAEDRRLLAERIVELDVLRRVREVIFASDDMSELHFNVVHHIHEVENKRSIRTPDRHVRVRRRI